MRKGRDGGETRKNGGGRGRRKENYDILVATDVVDSRPPERRLTGTPTTHANFVSYLVGKVYVYSTVHSGRFWIMDDHPWDGG